MYRITLPKKTKKDEDGKEVSAYLGEMHRRAGVGFIDGQATTEEISFHALFYFNRIGATVEKKSGNGWKKANMTKELAAVNPSMQKAKKGTKAKAEESDTEEPDAEEEKADEKK